MVSLKTKPFWIVFFLLIFLLIAFLTQKNLLPKSQSLASPAPIQTAEKTINETVQWGKITAAYPMLANADADREIEAFVQGKVSEFKKMAAEPPPVNDPNYKYEFLGQYQKYQNGQFLSVVFDIYEFAGGAHGSTNITPFVYDQNWQRLMQIADLFEKEGYLKYLSDTTRTQLKAKIPDLHSEEFTNGTAPKEENFNNFYFKDDSLVLVFGQYTIGPYAIGINEAIIPLTDLNAWLKKSYK